MSQLSPSGATPAREALLQHEIKGDGPTVIPCTAGRGSAAATLCRSCPQHLQTSPDSCSTISVPVGFQPVPPSRLSLTSSSMLTIWKRFV